MIRNLLLLAVMLGWAAVAVGAPVNGQPPGRLFSVGTHRLHLHCEGEHTPTVVFESGLAGLSLEWLEIQRQLATRARTCAYDRAGYGWSEPGPEPRTSARIVDELQRLLARAGIKGPLILVGHSFGGLNAQLYAHRYPHQVAGLLLIEASHADQIERFKRPPLNLNTAPSNRWRMPAFAAEAGLPQHFPSAWRNIALQILYSPRTRNAFANEYLSLRESAAAVGAERAVLGIPVVVLSRGLQVARGPRAGIIESVWSDLQAELARLSPYAAHIIARHSGHHVHLDQPQLVVDAVNLLVDSARQLAGNADAASIQWLAFADAEWRKNTLHAEPRVDPHLRGRLAQNGLLLLGWSAAAGSLAVGVTPTARQAGGYPLDSVQ